MIHPRTNLVKYITRFEKFFSVFSKTTVDFHLIVFLVQFRTQSQMSASTVPSSLDTSAASTTRQFNILDMRDYCKVIEELSQNTKLSDLMQKSFHMKYDMTRGLQFDELQELLGSDHGSNAQFVLEEVQKLSNGQSTCLVSPSENLKGSEITLIFGQKLNEKYDVLDIRVQQTMEIDQQKLASIAVGAACAGIFVGTIATPIAGAIATGAILAGMGLKTAHDKQKSQPDLLYAYIFKQLNDKQVLRFEDGHPFI